jgi:hypothetical protein
MPCSELSFSLSSLKSEFSKELQLTNPSVAPDHGWEYTRFHQPTSIHEPAASGLRTLASKSPQRLRKRSLLRGDLQNGSSRSHRKMAGRSGVGVAHSWRLAQCNARGVQIVRCSLPEEKEEKQYRRMSCKHQLKQRYTLPRLKIGRDRPWPKTLF